ncbi:3,9-dihydroxypterocarpan 6A-monooxygenase [Cajanus cajan]|uniref:Cytochrome P450 93A1 n=1 Tax=Cajanus cajan TaxID=3821 RepID=A0A151RU23_CAJCA|nr:3,9-dihydroxypterocarpan 6A-monooxygenase [Cajanus cajan]KYP46040.1 Cytochrome P450 93A1 [Cajanus cajan]
MDDIQGYIQIFLVCIASTILLRAVFKASKYHLPPSPLALPVIGHFYLLKPPLHRSFQKLSNRYGPLIHLYLGSTPIVVVSSAETAKEIFKTHELSFSNRPANAAISYLTYDSSDLGFSPYGTFWKFMKKLCMSELLNGRMLDQLLPIRQEEINRFVAMIKKKGEVCQGVNVGEELLKLTNSIVMRMAVSKSCLNTDDEAHKVVERVKECAVLSGRFNLADYFWFCKGLDLQGIGKRLKEVRGRFDTMMEIIIREHEDSRDKSSVAKDVLDALLSISEDQSSEVKITRDNIKAFLVDMFTGGTDTTAVTLEWSLAELINHPTVMEKARKEIDSIIGKDRIVTELDIENLPYLQAIVKETLRLHPPSPFVLRESTKDCIIVGYDIPAKTQVFTNVWAIGRDPKHWDNPLEFRPERFLSKDDETGKIIGQVDVRGQHYQFLPFGSGRRGCPGTSLALKVAHTTLAAMIQCFEWKGEEEENGGNCGSIDMKEGPSFILSRAEPLICLPKPRLVPFPLCYAC